MWSNTFPEAIKVKLFVTALCPEGVCGTSGGPKMQWKPQQKPIESLCPVYLIWKILVILSSLLIPSHSQRMFRFLFVVWRFGFFWGGHFLFGFPLKACPSEYRYAMSSHFCNQNADHLATRHWLFPTNPHPPWSPAVVPRLAPVQASLVDQRSQTSMRF